MPLHGFTAVDLGYQQSDAVSNIVNRFDESPFTGTYLQLFDQIWNDPEKLEDVTSAVCDHIATVYLENSPERIYFLMLYNIFSEFLSDIDEDVLPNDRIGYRTPWFGKSSTTIKKTLPSASSISLKPITAASSPTASAWARHSRHWPSSNITN